MGHPDPYDSTAEKVFLGYGAGRSYDGSEEKRTEVEIVCRGGLYKGNYVSLLNKHTWNKRHHCEIYLIHSKGHDFLVFWGGSWSSQTSLRLRLRWRDCGVKGNCVNIFVFNVPIMAFLSKNCVRWRRRCDVLRKRIFVGWWILWGRSRWAIFRFTAASNWGCTWHYSKQKWPRWVHSLFLFLSFSLSKFCRRCDTVNTRRIRT